jgi:hypothetical protein
MSEPSDTKGDMVSTHYVCHRHGFIDASGCPKCAIEQHHIPPTLLEALRKFIVDRAYHGNSGGDWSAVEAANKKGQP